MNAITSPAVLSASTLKGEEVVDWRGETLGRIEEIIIDIPNGRVAYVVLSFGGLLGSEHKLYAVPWSALQMDAVNRRFLLNAGREQLENAPGFDKDNWPDFTDRAWGEGIYSYYRSNPYWG